MKRIKNFIKRNLKTVLAFVIGACVAGGGVYAADIVINGDKVGYTDTNNIGATNVQDAIDKLYNLSTEFPIVAYQMFATHCGWPYSNYGDSTCSSTYASSLSSIKSSYLFFAMTKTDLSGPVPAAVCIYRKNRTYCFYPNNDDGGNVALMRKAFSDVTCSYSSNSDSDSFSCDSTDFACSITMTDNGRSSSIRCAHWRNRATNDGDDCVLYSGGSGYCGGTP